MTAPVRTIPTGLNEIQISRPFKCAVTTWARPFFVLLPGMFQVAPSSLSSSRVMPAISFRLWPVSSNTLSSGPNTRGASAASGASTDWHACQNQRISSAVSTRSRAFGPAGRCTLAHGLLSTRRCRLSQLNMLERAARSARPRLSDMLRLRAVMPGIATRRASSMALQISWPSMAATGRSAQRCARPPFASSGSPRALAVKKRQAYAAHVT